MIDEIKQQLDFVEWLKNQGIYNPMESAHTMRRMFSVYNSINADLKIVYESLIAKDYIAAIEILSEVLKDGG